ncbi:MAG: cytochrome ubiquinol oxidase subunit I [Actinomycetaceae bacterium]|nr:cytochrome ubiquinol oxidase subunit I [Actinomycetaceae bacterium]
MSVVSADIFDALTMARWQFGITTVYHFILVPFTIGMSLCVAILQTIWLKTQKDVWLKATRFFGKLFLINFALGVATGIVQEFQFGMNWSEYSRYVGDIFGAPLACEALLSFFLESTFLGMWIFGWGRLSAKAHTWMIWLATIGVNTSALWIIGANSWMQHPVGAVVDPATGRAQLDGVGGFFAVILNPVLWVAFFHVVTSAWLLAGTFIAGVSIWWIVRSARAGAETEARNVWKPIARFGLVVTIVGGILTGASGHMQAVEIAYKQPAKMAAAEALCGTTPNAPFTVAAFGSWALDAKCDEESITYVGQIPSMLSILKNWAPSTTVEGINDLNAEFADKFNVNQVNPPIMITFWTFRLMMLFGIFSVILAVWGLYALRGERITTSTALSKFAVLSLPMPFIGINIGWIFTEIGRQPFIVYPANMAETDSSKLVYMLTENGVSGAVPGWQVFLTMILFTVIYAALGVVWYILMKRYVKEGITMPHVSSKTPSDTSDKPSPHPAHLENALSFGY